MSTAGLRFSHMKTFLYGGIFSVLNRPYFKLFLITYKVYGSSRNLTPRNTTRDAFTDK